jgi:hypothetical protein
MRRYEDKLGATILTVVFRGCDSQITPPYFGESHVRKRTLGMFFIFACTDAATNFIETAPFDEAVEFSALTRNPYNRRL